jgi:hypothetical protein
LVASQVPELLLAALADGADVSRIDVLEGTVIPFSKELDVA